MSTTGSSAAPLPAEEGPQPRVPFPEEIRDDDLARRFALSEEDRCAIRRCRGDVNRIGFALQLCYARWRGRFATSFDAVPEIAVKHLAEQLDVPAPGRFVYPDRERTRREHNEAIREHLHLRAWQPDDAEMLRGELVRRAIEKRLPERDMLPTAERILMERRILLPGESVLRPVARRALGQVEEVAVAHISQRIDAELGKLLEEVLEVPKGRRQSRLQDLKRYPGRAYPKTIRALCQRIQFLRERGIERLDLSGAEQERILDFAERVRHYYARPIARFRSPKKRALLACFLTETLKDATDGAVRIFERVMQRMINQAEKQIKEEGRDFRKSARRIAGDWVKAGSIIEEGVGDPATIGPRILEAMPLNDLSGSVAQAREMLAADTATLIDKLVRRYRSTRKFMPGLLENVRFQPGPGCEDLIAAAEAIAAANRDRHRDLPADVPISPSVVPPSWRPFVLDAEGAVIRKAYEVCVAFRLKEALGHGEVFVHGSRKYVPIATLLYPDATWHERQAKKERLLPEDVDEVLEGLREQEARAYRETDEPFPSNTYASIKDGHLKLSKDPAEVEGPEVKKTRNAFAARMAPVRIERLMDWVDRKTNLCEIFQPPVGYDLRMPLPVRRRALHAGILGLATGLGLWTMGQIARGVSYSQLAHVADWALTEVLLSAANDHLVNLHHALPFSRYFGEGKCSSSDGIRFRVRVPKLLSEPSPKYFGWGEGLTSYKAMSDQWSIFSTQVITSHESEAMRMLDALLSNRTTLPLGGGHAADSAAATRAAFALCNLCGLPFWPCRADLHKVRFWKLDRSFKTEHLESLFDGAVKVEIIRKQWDNVRRLVASLRDRVAPAHVLGRCLSASISHDPLSLAVDEIGKIYESIYYVQVLGSPELRSASRHLRDHHESQNQLGRALVIGAKGEIRAPDQEVAAATLFSHTLVQTKILYYNTWHYDELLPELQAEGFDVRPEVLAKVSPLLYRHINFRGTYDFTLSDDEGAL